MKTIAIRTDGDVRLPLAVRRNLQSSSVLVESFSPGHVLLSVAGEASPVLLTGCLGELSVADLVSFFNMFRRSGQLHFDLPAGQKDVWFQDGEIVYATSTYPEEDLGTVLQTLGKFDAETLDECRRQVTAGYPIGKVLMDRGVVDAQDIKSAISARIEMIVCNVFSEKTGSFYYRASKLDKKETVKLSMNTQNLLMEGLRRLDERTLFMRCIPSLEASLVPADARGDAKSKLQGEMLNAYQLIVSQPLSVRELIRKLGVGEFEGLRICYQLAERKVVQVKTREEGGNGYDIGSVLDQFNEIFSLVSQFSKTGADNFRAGVESFVRGLEHPFSLVLRDVELNEGGAFERSAIEENLKGVASQDQLYLMADALTEVLYMECLVFSESIDEGKYQELVRRVQNLGHQLQLLAGRGR